LFNANEPAVIPANKGENPKSVQAARAVLANIPQRNQLFKVSFCAVVSIVIHLNFFMMGLFYRRIKYSQLYKFFNIDN
jgi:hypothetical protein